MSDDPAVAPMHWWRLPAPTREHVGAAAIALLDDHGAAGLDDLVYLLWERTRAELEPATRNILELNATPQRLLRAVLQKLAAVGGVEAALRQRRDAIDLQLERLAKLRGRA